MRIQRRLTLEDCSQLVRPLPPARCAQIAPLRACADVFEPSAPAPASRQIAASRAQRDMEKMQLPEGTDAAQDKFNEKRELKNEKLREQVAGVDEEISRVACDSSLKPADREKKLAALEKKRTKLVEQIKPPVDMLRVTQEIDAISNSNMSNEEKKKAIEAVRVREGLPKHDGKISMRAVTQHLSKVEKNHAKRMNEAQGEAKRHLAQVGKTFGKNSVQYLQAKARVDEFDQEAKVAQNNAGFLGSLYPKPVGFWGKIGNAFKKIGGGIWNGIKKVGGVVGKIANFAMPLIKMIPGVGQIAGAVHGGISAFGKVLSGDWRGALSSIAGAIPGVGTMLDKVRTMIPGLDSILGRATSLPVIGGLLKRVF